MKILLSKLYAHYGRYTDVATAISPSQVKNMKKGKLVRYYTICKKIPAKVLADLNYTFNDFSQDYPFELDSYIEKEMIYKIYSLGYSLVEYAELKNISWSALRYALIKGMSSNLIATNIQNELNQNKTINNDTLEPFRLVIEETYCKLIGDKLDLEKFRENYNIKYPILQYSKSWHLAFDGYWFRKIRDLK